MATVVLQTVGSVVGGALGGPVGAAIGSALGSLAGSYIDQQLFGPDDQKVVGPRLENAQVLSSREGAPIPRIFGRSRLLGEIIWATRFKEVHTTETRSQGGKGGGGPKTTVESYSYFANFAIALCEGEITGIGRIWADGSLFDQSKYKVRVYRGTEGQRADSFIEAKQGKGNAPAYRGLAYIVFENFALEEFGNRIPQIAVEVIRSIGLLEKHVHGVNLIPGATEFGYDPQPVVEQVSAIKSSKLNIHQSSGDTDFIAALDELLALCPNLKQIALVVAWFGDDLRASHCSLQPCVEISNRNITSGENWRVADLNRGQARLVSMQDGSPVYGGTPSDKSVVRAIQAIKARGIKVCLNPFIMMDIVPNNGLTDPYGRDQQAVFPWRGRITVSPARGQPDSVEHTDNAASQIQHFVGSATTNQITLAAGKVRHNNINEWSYRRMIIHYARLAQMAGGIDMFLIGSEMRELTSVRDGSDNFPFVEALKQLAGDVSPLLGSNCLVTYGADWSEYFGFHPDDNSNNVYFHLDTLWASPHIDAVGIDNYMPLSDWRVEGDPSRLGRTSNDRAMLSAQVASGEGYDWYYKSSSDRMNAVRTPITDSLNKPWVFRYKDIRSWWENPHYERRNGSELTTQSPWVPQSKPIIFTEYGCPAIHNGAAQPNVFYDAKSSESAVPYGSTGGRDDQAQMSYILAQQAHWDESFPGFVSDNNPQSSLYNGRMVDFDRSQLWAWDARPFPAFPDLSDVWSDAENWYRGHWLNGRLGQLRLADLIQELLLRAGVSSFNVEQVVGTIDGYMIGDNGSIRGALEVLVNLYQLIVYEDAGILFFKSPGNDPATFISEDILVYHEEEALRSFHREQEIDLPSGAHFQHIDPTIDFQQTETYARRINVNSLRQETISAPMVVEREQISPILHSWLHDRWTGREKTGFSLSNAKLDLTVGDQVYFENDALAEHWRIEKIEEGIALKISARAVENGIPIANAEREQPNRNRNLYIEASSPYVVILDLPFIFSDGEEEANLLAVSSDPWSGAMIAYTSAQDDDFSYRQTINNSAFIGELLTDLNASHASSRWNYADEPLIKLYNGTLSSASMVQTLNGANGIAVRSTTGEWEVVQFEKAVLVDNQTWKLQGLLRGQAGTEQEMAAGAVSGAEVVVLNQATIPVHLVSRERGLEMDWLVGPVGNVLGNENFTKFTHALGYRGLTPYSPVHLRANQGIDGSLLLDWVRRERLKSDDWAPLEIPLHEERERYHVILSVENFEPLSVETSSPSFNYSASQLQDHFGTGSHFLSIDVAQISTSVGDGPSTTLNMSINL